MLQKTAGSALLELLDSGKLVIGRVRPVVFVKGLFARTGLAKFLMSLGW